MERVVVATNRSDTATRAVEWAAEMARRYEAELLVLQVVAPEHIVGATDSDASPSAQDLSAFAERIAGGRGRGRLVYDSDAADAIVRVAAEERADVLVVGNVTMSGRSEFLLGSVPNRVSHNATCTVVIVNTAGNDGTAATATAVAKDATLEEATEGELLGRAAHIVRVIGKFGLQDILIKRRDGAGSAVERARRFRNALEELGPTFAKLGQILSTRPDLIPPAFTEELSTLQDQVKPLTEAEVVAVMEGELRVPWEDVFVSIEPDPMAAGTIAQVHRAVLVGGDRVVVKVQRPNAAEEILRDLGLLERLADKASQRPAFRQVIDVPTIIEHLSASLRRELDFREEAANIERMRTVLQPFDRLDVPKVYTEISTSRLLVMQEVQGVAIRQAPQGDARQEAARQLLESYCKQVLTDGFFHADPHPGNLMWWNEKIYFIDFGMVGAVDPEMRGHLLLLLLAFWQEDSSVLAEVMLTMSGEAAPAGFDDAAFREDLGALISRYRHLSLQELRLGQMLQELTAIALRYEIRLPSSVVLVGKAFGQMQLATAELDPTLDPFSVLGRYFLGRFTSQLRGLADPRQLFFEAQKLRFRAAGLLTGLERLTGARPGAAAQVDVRGTQCLENAIGRASRRVAVAFASATALVAASISAGGGHAPGWLTPTLGAVGALLGLGVLIDLFRRR
jgi:ubiquinone biosynthesis protein